MNFREQGLTALKAQLKRIAASRDDARLRACLSGMYLPAIGGDYEPAELIQLALELPPLESDINAVLARLAARLVEARAVALEQAIAALPKAVGDSLVTVAAHNGLLEDENYVYNFLLLSSNLPRNAELFRELKRFSKIGLNVQVLITGSGRVAMQLRRALIHQQTDASLEADWLGSMPSRKGHATLDAELGTALIEAWRGLLWIPPDPGSDLPLSLGRIEKGLSAFHDAIADTTQAVSLMRYAVRRLAEAYPLAPQTWRQLLEPRLEEWPELLRDAVMEHWPVPEDTEGEVSELELPGELQTVWQALDEPQRIEARRLVTSGEQQSWQTLWGTLLFNPPAIDALPRQTVISKLNQIKQLYEQHFHALTRTRPEDTIAVDIWDAGYRDDEILRRPRHRTRLDALDSVNRSLHEIARLLQRKDKERARAYLTELIDAQEISGTEAEHIAKTLSKAATIVRDSGHLTWAEDLFDKACRKNPMDEVPHCGLADILKAQGRFGEAEGLYRGTISRWPNSEVAHNGLADTLKAQGRFGEAEGLYRDTISRWPNSEVAHNGLADTLKAQGRFGEAEALCRHTINRWPNNEFAHCGLADILNAQGRFSEAEALYRDTISRWPNDEVAHCGLADTLKAQGRFGEAEALYRDTINRWPNDEVAHNGLADTLKAQGRFGEAEALYRDTINRWPNDEFAHNGLADTLKAQGRFSEAEALYRDTISRWPNSRVARNGLANVLRKQRCYDDALLFIPEPLSLLSMQDLYDLHLRGLILLQQGSVPAAVAAFQRGYATPSIPAQQLLFKEALMMVDLKEKRYDDALERSRELPASVVPLQIFRVHAHAGAGRKDPASNIYQALERGSSVIDFTARKALQEIDRVYHIAQVGDLLKPSEEQLAEILDLEIDMALAA